MNHTPDSNSAPVHARKCQVMNMWVENPPNASWACLAKWVLDFLRAFFDNPCVSSGDAGGCVSSGPLLEVRGNGSVGNDPLGTDDGGLQFCGGCGRRFGLRPLVVCRRHSQLWRRGPFRQPRLEPVLSFCTFSCSHRLISVWGETPLSFAARRIVSDNSFSMR